MSRCSAVTKADCKALIPSCYGIAPVPPLHPHHTNALGLTCRGASLPLLHHSSAKSSYNDAGSNLFWQKAGFASSCTEKNTVSYFPSQVIPPSTPKKKTNKLANKKQQTNNKNTRLIALSTSILLTSLTLWVSYLPFSPFHWESNSLKLFSQEKRHTAKGQARACIFPLTR